MLQDKSGSPLSTVDTLKKKWLRLYPKTQFDTKLPAPSALEACLLTYVVEFPEIKERTQNMN